MATTTITTNNFHSMKQTKMGDYLSPQAVFFSLHCEGVLCGSLEKEYGGSTGEGYTSSDDLYEIF